MFFRGSPRAEEGRDDVPQMKGVHANAGNLASASMVRKLGVED